MIAFPFNIPSAPDWKIDWKGVNYSPFGALLAKMGGIRQNPVWHGEGDVLAHTRLVCDALVGDPVFRAMDETDRAEVFVAALLHDVGKIAKTKMENGTWVSPGHSIAGALFVRKMLWQVFDMAGTEEKRRFRETVCSLIRFHSAPPHFMSKSEPERFVGSIAAEGCVTEGFTLEKLCMLVRADILGRKASDVGRLLDELALFTATAKELGCLDGPPRFADPFSRLAWLEGRTGYPEQKLYNDTWGHVYMMCALPGTGKDTWIRSNLPDVPMVSLDAIRAELGVSWEDGQGPVVARAFESAREYLRAHRSFVWNATCLTPDLRKRELQLFRDYDAYTEIVVLEVPWEEGLRRNRNRKAVVPEDVIDSMLGRFTPPSVREAHEVLSVVQRDE